MCPHSVCDSDPSWPVTISRPWVAIKAWQAQLWTQGPGPATGPASTQRGAGDSHRRHPPISPSPAWPSQEGAYLCSPNLESIEAEWLHFKYNYYKPFRECEFQNEISLSKLSLMRSCCAGIGLHRCLTALHGDQILGGAVRGGASLAPRPPSSLQTPKNPSPPRVSKKTKTKNRETLSWEHVHLDFSKASDKHSEGGHYYMLVRESSL